MTPRPALSDLRYVLLRAVAVWLLLNPSDAARLRAQSPSQQALHEERKRLDETVWAREVAAQKYEETFVALWDALRMRKDKRTVLAEFPFEELTLGTMEAGPTQAWGIKETTFGGAGHALTPQQWSTQLAEWDRSGYHLVQSEWHHATFDAATSDKPARSTVSMTLHATHPDRHLRLMIKGILGIEWSNRKDSNGNFVPRRIDAARLSMKERSGAPAFVEKYTVETNRFKEPASYVAPVLACDLDHDGLSEIVLPNQNAIHWNRGEFKFERTKLCDQLTPPLSVSAAIVADLSGDGIPDLLVAGENMLPTLFTADKQGRFTGNGHPLPGDVKDFRAPMAITAGDVNGDARPDIFLAQYKQPYVLGQMPTPYFDANDGFPSFLYLNKGGGEFAEATEQAGLGAKRFRRTYSTSFIDLDDDRDLDLLVVSDFSGVDLYRNDGTGRFTDITKDAIDERSGFGMSHAIADFNRDGRLDFFVAGMGSTTARRLEYMKLGREEFPEHQRMRMKMGYGNRMYLAGGGGEFRQPAFNDQVARTGWSWGCTAFDFGNDGNPDLYVANGHISGTTSRDYCTRFWTQDIHAGNSQPNHPLFKVLDAESPLRTGTSWNGFEHKALLLNEGGRAFKEAGFLMDVAFEFDGRGVLSDDLDSDGRVDLLLIEFNNNQLPGFATERLHVLQNQWVGGNHWIGVRVEDAPGLSSIGAQVTVLTGSGKQVASVLTGDSHRAQHAATKHFGLGGIDAVQALDVRWPNGKTAKILNPAVDRYHQLSPPD